MIVKTDDNYWDCECDENYIHKKSVTLFCSVCKMTEDEFITKWGMDNYNQWSDLMTPGTGDPQKKEVNNA